MSKQDRQGVRTPADLERKYNFEQLESQANTNSDLYNQINQMNQSMAIFETLTSGSIEELSDDVSAQEQAVVELVNQTNHLKETVDGLDEEISQKINNALEQAKDSGEFDGPTGADGKTSYLHIKYSDDGETFTANNGDVLGSWIGTLVNFTETASTTFSDYTWKRFTEDATMVVTVEADSLATENLTSDKTFSEIEEAILAGKDVKVKLISDQSYYIYLQVTAHIPGSEIDFCGYYNGNPLMLQLYDE